MAPNRFMTDLDFTKTQMAVYFCVILLSVDDLNPIRIVCRALPGLQPWHMATLATGLLIYILLSELKQVLYFGVKIFFHSILSIFFQSVEVVGLENIPRFGPVIFTINHANQFIDATAVLSTCQHKISYLMAEASYNRRIIGDLAWAMEVVPVKRAQDEAKKGTGHILNMAETATASADKGSDSAQLTVDTGKGAGGGGTDPESQKTTQQSESQQQQSPKQSLEVQGDSNTCFLSELAPGDKIRPLGTPFGFKVVQVKDNHRVVVDGSGRPADYVLPNNQNIPFDVLKKVDTHVVFEKVLDRLASGGAVGIFPEGGSHDRTELLPLKVGVALIAYGALDQHGLSVPIIPVGLNYFRAHRWRGKAMIEYGKPTVIDPSTLPQFQAGGTARRQVCNALLEDIERSMKSVIVSAPDYDTLQLVHTARRLWQRKNNNNTKGTPAEEKQDLTRRFAQGYQLLLQHPNPPNDWIVLQQRIQDYRNTLKDLGIRDYQVPALTEEHYEQELLETPNQALKIFHLTYQILHLLFLIAVAAIPFLLINFPVGILAGVYSESRRKKALQRSKVKVKGYDVMLTEKVIFCIVAVPTLWMFYAAVLLTLTDWQGPTIILCVGCLPLFSYMGIVAAEAGMVDIQDLRPLLVRLNPSARKRLAALPAQRKRLQDDLRAFIRQVGPKYLGELYYKEKIDWTALWEKEAATSSGNTPRAASSVASNGQGDGDEKKDADAASNEVPPMKKEL